MFNLLESLIVANHGESAWDDILETTNTVGAYTSLGNYPDAEIARLLEAAMAMRGEASGGFRWFGRASMPLLAQRYPVFFTPHTTTTQFLLTLNDIIHTEVRKIYPGADVPVFDFELVPRGVALGYHSERRMCQLGCGLIEGAADHFHERVTIEQPKCMLLGDDKCLLVCTFDDIATNQ